ncbi:hypothetical protein IWX90DRAFT_63651 [Phyllosticta citrichinensis]|uniref:Uncharacterized protein n=1 Tax=Phyllosticta citrichinensis TaxID=1130410 RepID=A0ABR1XHE8_9PEZI
MGGFGLHHAPYSTLRRTSHVHWIRCSTWEVCFRRRLRWWFVDESSAFFRLGLWKEFGLRLNTRHPDHRMDELIARNEHSRTPTGQKGIEFCEKTLHRTMTASAPRSANRGTNTRLVAVAVAVTACLEFGKDESGSSSVISTQALGPRQQTHHHYLISFLQPPRPPSIVTGTPVFVGHDSLCPDLLGIEFSFPSLSLARSQFRFSVFFFFFFLVLRLLATGVRSTKTWGLGSDSDGPWPNGTDWRYGGMPLVTGREGQIRGLIVFRRLGRGEG